MKKCTSPSKRHVWEFKGNTVIRTQTQRVIRLSKKGIYICEICNARKYGTPGYVPSETMEEEHA